MWNTHRAFGVEQEHFIFDTRNRPPSHGKIEQLWGMLIKKGFGIRCSNTTGAVLSLEKITDDGPLIVSNDSCTHILETAFPKLTCLKRFRNLYTTTWNDLNKCLAQLGLYIRFGGALHAAPTAISWRPKEGDTEGERLRKFLSRSPIDHPLYCQSFPACFASTHVSLDISAQEAIGKLPYYYSHEHNIPRLFSTSTRFQTITAHCVRPLAWVANFHQPYPLIGIPTRLPRTLSEYESMRQQCAGRDYSFVAIRDPNRLEFRSACSQNSVDDIERLVRFRLDIDRKFTSSFVEPSEKWSSMRFVEACLGRFR